MTHIEIQLDEGASDEPPEMFVIPTVLWGDDYQKYTIQLYDARVYFWQNGAWQATMSSVIL
jgi:hypothetical protein